MILQKDLYKSSTVNMIVILIMNTIIQMEDSSMPMQVKQLTVQEGYNHDSIVTSLITTKSSCNVNRNAKKLN